MIDAKIRQDALKEATKKEGQANRIAPLQPPTVAAFRPWRGSEGAGRTGLALPGATQRSGLRAGSAGFRLSRQGRCRTPADSLGEASQSLQGIVAVRVAGQEPWAFGQP